MDFSAPSHWCHSCNSFVRVHEDSVCCLDCGGGFVEELELMHQRLIMQLDRVLRRQRVLGDGLRGLVAGMSEVIMGAGFDRILEHFIQFDMMRVSHPPASKVAVDGLPTIEINVDHVKSETHCARNSCPVCRHELPSEATDMDGLAASEESMELIIWRLPRGGYGVGRLNGGRIVGENEVPDDYNETDNVVDVNGSSQRRIIWSTSGIRRRGRGISQAFHNIMSFFSRSRSSPRQLNVDIGFDDEVSRISRRRRAVQFETVSAAGIILSHCWGTALPMCPERDGFSFVRKGGAVLELTRLERIKALILSVILYVAVVLAS
ncbi:hypothetical protein POM88_047952 [Heracleum sosnowskyi]|uniref:RING-type E3 ubiquitin transferase n=1 Tax=Heracleum sosnowskyi TaxID=360622 RepID=A0AAD8GU70_9APIA|nr:hypothetical protein POM88_047952 [Heracleum sosnowskyi]